MPNIYDIGQEVRHLGTFQDATGAAVAPGTVRFLLIPPGQTGTYYPAAGTLALGTYYYDIRYNAGGYWGWGWEGTGTINTTTYDRDFVRYMGTGL